MENRDKIAIISIVISIITLIATIMTNLYTMGQVISANREIANFQTKINVYRLLFDFSAGNPERQEKIIERIKIECPDMLSDNFILSFLSRSASSTKVVETLGGWAGIDPINNKYEQTINNWSPENRYIFNGELVWDPQLKSTRGDIILTKEGVKIKITEWKDPPGGHKWSVDVTNYISGNGKYFIEWVWIEGVSGVHIRRSDITSIYLK
jgi:hypothetical protein